MEDRFNLKRFVFVLPLIASSCIQDNPTPLEAQVSAYRGGSDTGGGDIRRSTPREVIEALWRTRAQIIVSQGFFSEQTAPSQLFISDDPYDAYLKPIWQTIQSPPTASGRIDATGQTSRGLSLQQVLENKRTVLANAHPSSALVNQPFVYGSMSECAGFEEKDGAVSKHQIDGTICFSVSSLQRHSPTSLNRVAYGLWIHEISHLVGYGETEARDIQDAVEARYEAMSSDLIVNLPHIVFSDVAWAWRKVSASRRLFAEGNRREAFLHISEASQHLFFLRNKMHSFEYSPFQTLWSFGRSHLTFSASDNVHYRRWLYDEADGAVGEIMQAYFNSAEDSVFEPLYFSAYWKIAHLSRVFEDWLWRTSEQTRILHRDNRK